MESNKMVAEFMGFKKSNVRNIKGVPYDYDLPNGFELIKETETTIESVWCEVLMEQDSCMVGDLKFHKSWDWLMPVVDKIDEILPDDNFLSITYNRCLIEYDSEGITFEGLGNSRREATYKAVLEFIEWYNENK